MTSTARAERIPTTEIASLPALEVHDLSGPDGDPVLRNVSLLVERNETHVVFGPIHSGKSLLMRHILGLERAQSGTVTVDGETFDAARPSDDELRSIRRRIGVVFEGSALLSRMSVVENVELPLLEHWDAPAREARESARKLLRDVGVEVDDDTLPGELSRADQRRVALARALALGPAIVLLDEPSQGLDPHAAGELDETIAHLQRRDGFGVLLASHQGRYAFTRADRIHVLVNGEIVASGTQEAVRSHGHPVIRQLLERRGAR